MWYLTTFTDLTKYRHAWYVSALKSTIKRLVYNGLKQLEHYSQSNISGIFVCLVPVGEKLFFS